MMTAQIQGIVEQKSARQEGGILRVDVTLKLLPRDLRGLSRSADNPLAVDQPFHTTVYLEATLGGDLALNKARY